MVDDVGVVAQAADQDIGSETAVQGIGGVVAGEGIGPGIAGEIQLGGGGPGRVQVLQVEPQGEGGIGSEERIASRRDDGVGSLVEGFGDDIPWKPLAAVRSTR